MHWSTATQMLTYQDKRNSPEMTYREDCCTLNPILLMLDKLQNPLVAQTTCWYWKKAHLTYKIAPSTLNTNNPLEKNPSKLELECNGGRCPIPHEHIEADIILNYRI